MTPIGVLAIWYIGQATVGASLGSIIGYKLTFERRKLRRQNKITVVRKLGEVR